MPSLAVLRGISHICKRANWNWLQAHLPPARLLLAAGPATAPRSIRALPALAVAERGCRQRQAPLLPRLPLRPERQHLHWLSGVWRVLVDWELTGPARPLERQCQAVQVWMEWHLPAAQQGGGLSLPC